MTGVAPQDPSPLKDPSFHKDPSPKDPSPLRRTVQVLRPHLRRHRALAVWGLLALLADVVFRVLEPWPIKFAVDAVSQALGAELADRSGLGGKVVPVLVAAAGALIVIVIGRAVTNYASTICFALVGARVSTELRSRVFAHIQRLSLRYHSRSSVGDLSQRLVGDIGRLQEVAVTAGLPLIGNVVTLGALAVVMVVLNPVLGVIVVLTAVAYLLLSRMSGPKITHASRNTRKGEGQLVGSAAEALAAIRVVQTYALEDSAARAFTDGNARAMKAGVKARRLAARLERSTDVLVGIGQAAVIVAGGLMVVRGQLTPGDLVLFVMYLKIAMKPLRDLAKYTGRIARASASGERIADLMEVEPEIRDVPGALELGRVGGAITLHRVMARDGHGRPLFNGVDLHIPAGQRIGLLGPSGSGKTTLVNYLLRLDEPESGHVMVDGHGVQYVSLESLRRQFGVVLQESVLFAATVRENIRYGHDGASDEQVVQAAQLAGAHDFVTALPEGYDTVLGARGDTLSGGQRQRIAIARAMVRNAPIVVLDEPTTGLDPATRAEVTAALEWVSRGRTTVAITHDVATLAGLDRVVWLEDGRIVEDGAPQVLAHDPRSRFAQWLATQRDAGLVRQ
ncbi:MAG TPA: ABC transporter ATP-binding protein [Candidatus Avipropionibacterium avicola]|uniref:ABC transporter ATP-binding protein n=1 Tax=Candidatus Avipropionibacterium avicola TaxID=2840701 RepID=A0A9D1GVM7_9ACTN|nr:ABC transporter ATP-binding protein [Candidatus Avipropionibacterium avicola]